MVTAMSEQVQGESQERPETTPSPGVKTDRRNKAIAKGKRGQKSEKTGPCPQDCHKKKNKE